MVDISYKLSADFVSRAYMCSYDFFKPLTPEIQMHNYLKHNAAVRQVRKGKKAITEARPTPLRSLGKLRKLHLKHNAAVLGRLGNL